MTRAPAVALAAGLLAAIVAACAPPAAEPKGEAGAAKPAAEGPAPEAEKAAPAAAPPAVNGEIAKAAPATSAAIAGPDFASRIAILSADDMEGRAPASPGGLKASQWIADEMARIGLAPGGEDGTYFQAVPLVEATLDEAGSSLSIGAGGALKFAEDTVFWTKRLVDSVAFADSEVVFVGYGVVAPEYGWNDYEGLDARGKTVVMLVNDPGYATENPDLFKGRAMTYYGRWTYKFEEAARQGAAAALVIHETAPASYGWNVVRDSWSGAQFDLVHPDRGASRAALEGWLSLEAAQRLFAEAGLDFAAMKEAAKTTGFKPVPMGALKASGTVKTAIRELASRNVAGVVKGAERPDEYVLYTAHWDHLGKKDKAEPGADAIYNGAVDNATGVAAILEIGEAFAKRDIPPKRSVMILAVTAEESGLLGSAYYAEKPLVPLAKTVGGMNIDAILPVGRTRDLVVVGYGASELEDILREEAAAQDRVLKPDPTPEAGYFYRSDHVSLAKKGVPMLYADGGEDHREKGQAYGKAVADAYREKAYHQPSDEFSPDWDLSGMEEDATLLFRVGARLADGDAWPNWRDGNEFRALRDAQRASE